MNEEELLLIIKKTLATDFGFKLLKHLLNETGIFENTVNFESVNKQYFLQGKKSAGNYLLELIRIGDFDSYIKLQKEREE